MEGTGKRGEFYEVSVGFRDAFHLEIAPRLLGLWKDELLQKQT